MIALRMRADMMAITSTGACATAHFWDAHRKPSCLLAAAAASPKPRSSPVVKRPPPPPPRPPPPPPMTLAKCGNGRCDAGESCSICPQDCSHAGGAPCERVGVMYSVWCAPTTKFCHGIALRPGFLAAKMAPDVRS